MIPQRIIDEAEKRYLYLPVSQGDYGHEQKYVKHDSKIDKYRKAFIEGAMFNEAWAKAESDMIYEKGNIFNDKTIGKTIKDLPENYTWDDIFKIGIGIPTGTQNFLRTYFQTPSPTGDRDCEELKKGLEEMMSKINDLIDYTDGIPREMAQKLHSKAKQLLNKHP